MFPIYGGYAFWPWSIDEGHPSQEPTGEYIYSAISTAKSVGSILTSAGRSAAACNVGIRPGLSCLRRA